MNRKTLIISFFLILYLVQASASQGYWRLDGDLNDYSVNSNSGTVKGSSLYFDGQNDWVDVDVLDSPDYQYTVAAWIKPEDKTDRMIFRRAHCDALYMSGSSLELWIKRDDHAAASISISNSNLQENQWNFVAGTVNLNQSTAKIFANGNTNTKTIDINESQPLMSGNGMEDFIGGGGSLNGCPNPGFYKGWMDNVYLYDKSLTTEQLNSLYRGTHREQNLIGFWPMTDGSGLTVSDYSGNNYDGEIVQSPNLLNNSGFESGIDSTGNMDRIRTNYAGSSWVSNYSLFGDYAGRHNKTGEDDQWSAVEWSLNSLNTNTEYAFSAWYKCSGNVDDSSTNMNIRIFNGTGWELESTTNLDYRCNGRWNKTSGRVGEDVTTLQDTNRVRYQWEYSTNAGQMYVDNISLRVDGPEWSNEGFNTQETVYSGGLFGGKSADFRGQDNYLQMPQISLSDGFTVSAWFKPEGPEVGSKRNPGTSCLQIQRNGGSHGNGYYWIDPEGSENVFKVYCDMTTDGGGWTLVATMADGSFFQDCSAGSDVDLEYGSNCRTVCAEFTDDGDACDNQTEKNIQLSEMAKLEDKYVIEESKGSLENRENSDYVSPAFYSLEFEDTMFKDEFNDYIAYNFSNPDTNKGNLNYSLRSMTDFYRSANTHHLQLIFWPYKSNMDTSEGNTCGTFKMAIMAADADGADPDDYYTTDRKYLRYSAARAGPIWDSARNGGCGFDDAQGRWTARQLGGPENDQSDYIAWYVRDGKEVREAGVAQGAYSMVTANRTFTGINEQYTGRKTTPTWHHLTMVYENSTNTRKTYLDGRLINSETEPGLNTGLTNVKIGKYFNGKIDEVEIFDKALNSNELERRSFGQFIS